MGIRGELYSTKVSSDKRTYFFNVKENRTGDAFLNIVESKKEGEGEFERHQVMVYQEEIDLFLHELTKAAEVLRKHRDLNQDTRLRAARPRTSRDGPRSSATSERSHDASASHGAGALPRKPRTGKPEREAPKPTFELDGKWQGPESMKAVGGKVARISRKQIEERNAAKGPDQNQP